MTVKYLLTPLTPKTVNLYGFPWDFMIVHPWLVPTNRELKIPFFLTLRSVQTLSDPKVIDRIKKKLFGAIVTIRKIILEGGLVVVDDGSGSGAIVGSNDAPLIISETTNHYDYDHTGYTDFATSSKCSACKYQDYKVKHDELINVINVLTYSVKKITSKRGVIPSERISYPYTPLEIKVDVTAEATAEQHNITVDNPSTVSMKEEKVEPVSLGEQKNYPFERFCQQQPQVSRNEEWLINIIKDFSIPAGLPRYLIDGVYISINYGDEFHWVLVVVILKERCIQVYDSMSQRRCFEPSSEIQKLAKILPTYLDMSDFLDQKIRTDWSTIKAYRDKMGNPFDVEYIEGISQQSIGSL
ncbi:hypothetical protein FXO38_07082 [Capsicum annuum]|nr:hypothetical protein FXO38_07082 [Capsicum annuum]